MVPVTSMRWMQESGELRRDVRFLILLRKAGFDGRALSRELGRLAVLYGRDYARLVRRRVEECSDAV